MTGNTLDSPGGIPLESRARRRRLRIAATIVVLIVLVQFLWYIGVFGGNVRAVEAGRVYRCAQLTGNTLGRVLDRYAIRTVIDLRGGSPRDAFYRSEITECSRRRVAHVDIPFSARFLPPPQKLQALLHELDSAQYPVLLHCQGGSDRSGLAGTLYLSIYKHIPLDVAEADQLTWRYGHFSFGTAHAMDDFFRLYRRTDAGLDLREWIDAKYPALYGESPLALKGDAPDMSPSRSSAADPAPPAAPSGHPVASGG
jgi:hypothetical protein